VQASNARQFQRFAMILCGTPRSLSPIGSCYAAIGARVLQSMSQKASSQPMMSVKSL